MSKRWIRMAIAGSTVLAPLLLPMASGQSQQPATPANGSTIVNPFRGVMQDRSHKSPAEALYVEKCSMCHRRMGMGTVLLGRRVPPAQAMLEARDDLTPELIALAVRQGIGNMPRLSKAEVSDRQLAVISAYLVKAKVP